MENDEIICLKNVAVSYDKEKLRALNHVSLTVNKGEFVFIVGPSGSGKSTLIKLLLREVVANKGEVVVLGKNLNKMKHRHVPAFRRQLGVVFQDFRLLQNMNIYDNVAFAQYVIQVPTRRIKRNVTEILKMVGLAGKYKALPKQISGGEQQRVAIARALINKPEILICDEPTGNLDPSKSWEIMQLLDEVNKNGTTIVVVTHNREIVDAMQKRVIVMSKGSIESDEEKGEYSYEY
ncbi:MAG: cell division ATP-binding protein FtsE [Lachnospiraceae bacterium]